MFPISLRNVCPRRDGSAPVALRDGPSACEISEVSVKVCCIGLPCQSIHAGGGFAFERKERSSSRSTLTWCRRAVNFSFFISLVACRTRASPCDTRFRPSVRRVLCSFAFLLVAALGSTLRLRRGRGHFVRRLPSYYGGVWDFGARASSAVRLLASPMRTGGSCQTVGRETLLVPAQGTSAHARVSDHAKVVRALAMARLSVLPST